MPDSDYVHGYSDRESLRLGNQANTLSSLLPLQSHNEAAAAIAQAAGGQLALVDDAVASWGDRVRSTRRPFQIGRSLRWH